MSNEPVTFKGIAVSERYYSESSGYGVFNVRTSDQLEHSKLITERDSFRSSYDKGDYIVSVVGKMQHLNIGAEYAFSAIPEYNSKYNSWQYKPVQVISIAPKTLDESKSFLSFILTEKQAETLLSVYPNIIDDVINNRANVDLSKLKGIGQKTWDKIQEKILGNFVISDIITLLQPYGVSYAAIMRMLRTEENPSLLRQKIMNDPYVLTQVRGFGFRTVDMIALKMRPELRDSSKRAVAFVKHYLTDQAEMDGHTWVSLRELRSEASVTVRETLPKFDELIEAERKGGLFLKIVGDKVGLRRYFELEEGVYKILRHLDGLEFNHVISEGAINDGIAQTENEQGFSFSDEQKGVIHQAFKHNVVLISGKAGCVDADTEFFTGTGWKRIADYQDGDQVLQWNKDGTANLVRPFAYIKAPCDYLWEFKTERGIDQCLSEEHNCCWMSAKGKFHEGSFAELKAQQEAGGFYGRFITTFQYDGPGIPYSDALIRLFVAAIADGSYYYQAKPNCDSYTHVRFHIKKDRKKKRLVELFQAAQIKYWETPSVEDGYTDFHCDLPERIKEFPSSWYQCSRHQLSVIAEEVLCWKGYSGSGNRMENVSTTSKQNADFVQFVFSCMGHRSTIYSYDRCCQVKPCNDEEYERKSIEYQVGQTQSTLIGLSPPRRGRIPTQFTKYKTIDGYKYCFTVPSHYLVLRRHNRIFITGNSGKTSIARAILNIYNNTNCPFASCSLSAKAAQRIQEATGYRAQTMHTLLGSSGKEDYSDGALFYHNHIEPLEQDVIFLDETSMVNAQLLSSLLDAIKPGARIIMCGDYLQLPPIGCGNPFSDLLQMKDFASFELKTVHRQAAKSGILADANKIRAGQFPVEEPSVRVVNGEMRDMTYAFRDKRENMCALSVKRFLTAAEQDGIDNTIIITPRRTDCINSADELNKIIQSKLFDASVPFINRGYDVIKLGARVIQTTNNYEKNVMNGEIGYVFDVDSKAPPKEECMIVKYKDLDGSDKIVPYLRNELDEVSLAYALTVHKTQGSQWDNVIVVVDQSHYMLLDSCLLYTAITRAKKKCLLVAEPNAFRTCILKNKNISRRTWLRERVNAQKREDQGE